MNNPKYIDSDRLYWPMDQGYAASGYTAPYCKQLHPAGAYYPQMMGMRPAMAGGMEMQPVMAAGVSGMQRMDTMNWLTALALSDSEWENRQDAAYFLSMCPMPVRTLHRYVEDVCEEKENANSMLYDEYPDKVMLMKLRDQVLERAADDKGLFGEEGYFGAVDSREVKDMAEVLLYREIAARRRNRRAGCL